MSTALHPVTAERLQQFSRRRNSLLWLRGLSIIIGLFLAGMLFIAVLDSLFLLDDRIRIGLSLTLYTLTAFTFWLLLRPSIRRQPETEIARSMESLDNRLHERLLPAVELSTVSDHPSAGSPSFRKLVQQQAAGLMKDVDARRLLPSRLIHRSLALAFAAITICVVLLFLPDSQWPQRFLRALFPQLNLARVSTVQVNILQPSPASSAVPQDETLAIEVEVISPEPVEVTLETWSQTTGRSLLPMRPSSDRNFQTTLSIEKDIIEYRILAGDAITARHLLTPHPRPAVKSFQKTITYPSYAKLANSTTTEDHGNLRALTGSSAEILFELDQPVRDAFIEFTLSGSIDSKTIQLELIDDLHCKGIIPIVRPAEYQVRLVSAETGFDNPLSPKYSIEPIFDQPPRLQLFNLSSSESLVAADESLQLKGIVEDELPVATLEQWVSINEGRWTHLPRPIPTEAKEESTWNWDLLQHPLAVGDRVRTKLVAVDRNNQRAESLLLELLITTQDFDPDRHRFVTLRAKLVGLFHKYAEDFNNLKDQSKPWLESFQKQLAEPKPEHPDENYRQPHNDFAQQIQLRTKATKELIAQVAEVIQQLNDPGDIEELELISRVLGRIDHHWLNSCQVLNDEAWPTVEPHQRQQDLDQLRNAFYEAAESARQIDARYRHSFMHDLGCAIALDAHALVEHQTQAKQPAIHDDVIRLNRHQTVLARQLQAMDKFVSSFRALAQDDLRGHFDAWQNYFNHQAQLLERAIVETGAEPNSNSLAKLQNAHQQISDNLSQLESAANHFRWQLPDARREWERRGGTLTSDLKSLAQSAKQFLEHQRSGANTDPSGDSQRFLQKGQRLWRELVELQQPKLAQFGSRRVTLQANAVSDPGLVSDLELADRALRAVLKHLQTPGSAANTTDTDLQTIADAYGVLEAGHEIVEAHRRLITLTNDEQWQSQQFDARNEHPRRWMLINLQWDTGSRLLRESNLHEIAGEIDRIRWHRSMNEANQKFEARHNRPPWASAYDELQALNNEHPPVIKKLAVEMEAARKKLQALAPTLAELAKEAANEVRELQAATEQLAAESSSAKEPVKPREEFEQELKEANEKLERFVNTLVAEANQRNLTNAQERAAAKLADQQLSRVEADSKPMRETLQNAREADNNKSQKQQLDAAIEHQSQLANTLEQIAAESENPESALANKTEPAAQATETADPQNQKSLAELEQQYKQAERLEKLTQADAQELMRRLEEELKRNPEMQQELSEISQTAANEALATLKQSQNREEQLQRMIEQGDTALTEQKRDLAEDLRELANAAQQLNSHLMNPSRELADSAKQNEAAQALQKTFNAVQAQINEAQSARSDLPVQDLQNRAKELADNLKAAADSAKEAAEKLAQAQNQAPPNQSDRQRSEQKQSFERRQKELQQQLVRSAENRSREAEEQLRKATQAAQNAEKKQKEVQKDLEKAQQLRDREPNKQELANRAAELERKLQEAKASEQQATARQQAAKETAQQKKQALESAKKENLPELNAQNPAAELAQRWSQKSADMARQLAAQAEQLSQNQQLQQQLSPKTDVLNEAAKQQKAVAQDVQQAGQDIERAGRHEQRLGNQSGAKQLEQRGQDIEQTNQQSVTPAGEQLAQAAQSQGEPSNNQNADTQKSLAAREATAKAEAALGNQVQALESMLGKSQMTAQTRQDAQDSQQSAEAQPPAGSQQNAQSQQASTQNGNPSEQSNDGSPAQSAANNSDQSTPPGNNARPSGAESSRQRSQMMARLLDELDQNGAKAGSTNEPPNQASPTLSAAAEALAQAARQQRQQLQQSATQGEPSQESTEANVDPMPTGDFALLRVDRRGKDWGRLREQSAEDLTEAKREGMAPEYRKSLEVYYRVLSERARKK